VAHMPMLINLQYQCEEYNMDINVKQTKVMVISNNREEMGNLTVNGKHWNKCNNTSTWAA